MNPLRLRNPLLALVSLLAVLVAPAARADMLDKGSFKIYRNDKALGAETFDIVGTADSLVIHARQYLMLPFNGGEEPLEKGADLLLSRKDFALIMYQSTRNFRGTTTIRALTMADTHYVAFREVNGVGEGDSRVLPPGRLYVMDSQLISVFDMLCRSMQRSGFESRAVNLLALGPHDTLLDARVESLGSEKIKWGAKPVVAHKMHLVADSQTTFTLWAGPRGELLRLSEPVGGLRAEREAPSVKRKPIPAPKPNPNSTPSPGSPGG